MAGTNGDAVEPMKKQTVMLPAQTGKSQTKKIAPPAGKLAGGITMQSVTSGHTENRAPGRPDFSYMVEKRSIKQD